MSTKHVVGFSGGKDSTALALRMAEEWPGLDFELLFTPTYNEPPDVMPHVESVAKAIGRRLVIPPGCMSLAECIEQNHMVPNFRARFCTRQLKIVPCIAYLTAHPGSTLYVGLRADETAREGMYGDHATYRFPLREWGMGLADVISYCRNRGFSIPPRTDCDVCYHQRLGQWYALWRDRPDDFEVGVQMEASVADWREAETGERREFTFRSPERDSWPAGLSDLRAQFERGRVPKGSVPKGQESLWDENLDQCRECRF